MTCIVALKDNERVWMGADSLTSTSHDLNCSVRADPKVFRHGPFILGCSGSPRMRQILTHGFKAPDVPTGRYDPDDFIFQFTNSFHNALDSYRNLYIKDSTDYSNGNTLVAWGPHLYQIASDFQFMRVAAEYMAIGSGRDYALGYMFATRGDLDDPKQRVTSALKAAEYHNMGVRGPFRIFATK